MFTGSIVFQRKGQCQRSRRKFQIVGTSLIIGRVVYVVGYLCHTCCYIYLGGNVFASVDLFVYKNCLLVFSQNLCAMEQADFYVNPDHVTLGLW